MFDKVSYMEESPYKQILEDLIQNGEKAINRLLDDSSLESFYLDFKQIATQSSDNRLHDSDKENYVKAVSGFSNTSGGLLIWGIKESNKKFSKLPTIKPEFFASILNHNVSNITQPALGGINSFIIRSEDDNTKGYVITEIPKYFMSPVQVIADVPELRHKYYIRSGSSFVPANHDILTGLFNRERSSRLSYHWSTFEKYQENEKIIIYRFTLNLQNKGVGILRDVWINFSSSGFNIDLEKTNQTDLFTGWNIYGNALALVTIDGYKCAPQNIIAPFLINFVIKKESIADEAWLYFSFGANQVSPVEKKITISKKDLTDFISGSDKEVSSFIKFLGLGN